MTREQLPLCSITACPEPASESEQDEVGYWLVTIYYCVEHARQLAEGTPLGPAGVDNSRVSIEPVGSNEPQTGGSTPGIA